MSVSKSFLEHALDLLSLVEGASARPMFGGYGLYAGGGMFGLLDDDELFLRTDDESVGAFTARGCKQWVYPGPQGPQPTSNYRPPDEAMESAEAMLPWARLAIEANARKQAKKSAAAAAKAARAAAREQATSTKSAKPKPAAKRAAPAKAKAASKARLGKAKPGAPGRKTSKRGARRGSTR